MNAVDWAVALVALQRLAELAFAARNTHCLRTAGAVEYGAGHYPLLVLVHAGWLGTLLAFVPDGEPVRWPAAAAFVALQPLRIWIIASLGRRWTTRILVLPGSAPVRRGPYRWLRHPNYVVVAAEIALLPLAFGAWAIAAFFSILNGMLLIHRIRVENAAWRDSTNHGNLTGAFSRWSQNEGPVGNR